MTIRPIPPSIPDMRLLALFVIVPTLAHAEPFAATTELSLKIGQGKKDDYVDRSLFVSIILGGRYAALPWLDVALDLSATKATATWEEVSGLSNAALSATVHGARDRVRWSSGIGITAPLAKVGTIHDFPMDFTGDSLVYSATTEDEDTWDYSAYRRAAMNRGDWNMWMWAPDWITVFAPARFERDVADDATLAGEAALAGAFAIGDGHDRGDVAIVAQAAVDFAAHVNARSRVGARVLDVIVFYDDLSPHLTSVEPYYAWRSPTVDLRVRLTIPIRDHRHANSPGSGFTAHDEWGLNTSLAVAF